MLFGGDWCYGRLQSSLSIFIARGGDRPCFEWPPAVKRTSRAEQSDPPSASHFPDIRKELENNRKSRRLKLLQYRVCLWWRNFGPVFLSPARVLSRRIFRFLSRSQSTRLITCACVRRIFLPGPFCCEHEREACLTLWMNQTSLDQVVYTRGQQRRVVNCAAFRRDWRKKGIRDQTVVCG